jgi:hypothetical protein
MYVEYFIFYFILRQTIASKLEEPLWLSGKVMERENK